MELENLTGELSELRTMLVTKERENDMLSDRVMKLQYDLSACQYQAGSQQARLQQLGSMHMSYRPDPLLLGNSSTAITELQKYYSSYINDLNSKLHSYSVENSLLLQQLEANRRRSFRPSCLDFAVACDLYPADLTDEVARLTSHLESQEQRCQRGKAELDALKESIKKAAWILGRKQDFDQDPSTHMEDLLSICLAQQGHDHRDDKSQQEDESNGEFAGDRAGWANKGHPGQRKKTGDEDELV